MTLATLRPGAALAAASGLALCALVLAGCAASDEYPQATFDTRGAAGLPNYPEPPADLSGDRAGIGSAELRPGQAPPGTQEDLEVSVGDRIYFDYDSAVISPVATETLDRQAAWLRQYPDVLVTIEGHTDERGTREYNLALGDRRANSVKNYLVALDISPDRILTISYGEERPADPGNDETAWANNRRAVTVVTTLN